MMGFPQHVVWNIHDSAPVFRIGEMFLPVRAKIFGVNAMELGSRPRFGVDAVGNAGDRHFLNRNSCPDVIPKALADLPVQFAHAIGMTAHSQRENGHAEGIGRMRSRFSEPEKIFEMDSEIFRYQEEME